MVCARGGPATAAGEGVVPVEWSDTADQAAFRAEVRSFLEEELPPGYRNLDARGPHDPPPTGDWRHDRKSDDPEVRRAAEDWGHAVGRRGWTAPHWPARYGGADLSVMEQFIFAEEVAGAAAPVIDPIGIRLMGSTLVIHGTEEQRREHLPRMLAGDGGWAQCFSEPGAGSDLASLSTRAVRDGDEYVVNGQKIWTSGGHDADWASLLVRTDPEAPKHRGITFLMVDLHTPGIEVRPIVDATGRHYVNEVFFEDVRVPVTNRVGEENRGWYVATTLLDFERSNVSGAVVNRKAIRALLDYASGEGRRFSRLDRVDSLRQKLAHHFIQTEVQYSFSLRIASIQATGAVPNYEASVNKMFGSELGQTLQRTATTVFGLYAAIWDGTHPLAPMKARFTVGYVGSIPATIAAGSSEIQRNVIATRGLGLPRG